jgi:drug/metabolite transporter (DMT)-like permease
VRLSTGIALLSAISLATAGQLLLRAGMDRIGEIALFRSPGDVLTFAGHILSTWQVMLGLVLFGCSAVFWLISLSRLPLSVAYPAVSLSYVLILVFSYIVLGERPSLLVWSGAGLIVIGISLVGIGQQHMNG